VSIIESIVGVDVVALVMDVSIDVSTCGSNELEVTVGDHMGTQVGMTLIVGAYWWGT
jgi:hypothetical protein